LIWIKWKVQWYQCLLCKHFESLYLGKFICQALKWVTEHCKGCCFSCKKNKTRLPISSNRFQEKQHRSQEIYLRTAFLAKDWEFMIATAVHPWNLFPARDYSCLKKKERLPILCKNSLVAFLFFFSRKAASFAMFCYSF